MARPKAVAKRRGDPYGILRGHAGRMADGFKVALERREVCLDHVS